SCTACCPCQHPHPTAPPTLSLHDALPISRSQAPAGTPPRREPLAQSSQDPSEAIDSSYRAVSHRRLPCMLSCYHVSNCRTPERRSEEHTSELQSRFDLVCRLLLEKKKCVILPSARWNLAKNRNAPCLTVDDWPTPTIASELIAASPPKNQPKPGRSDEPPESP